MGIKAALFDLDGTLLDSMWVWRRVDERSLTARGVALPDDYTRAVSAMRMHDAAEYTARRFKLDVEPEALLAEWKAMARDEYAHNVPLKAHARELLAKMGLSGKEDAVPCELSGGQQQRVAIARALATKPAIILADEPTGNLDSKTSQDVLALMKVTSEKFGQTIVMITHNEEIAQLAHRIVRIEDGRIVHS